MAKRRTVTIELYHCYGTPNYHLHALHQGHVVSYSQYEGEYWKGTVHLDAPHWFGVDQDNLLREWRERLKRLGFTHWRFTGDWGIRTDAKPKGGKL